MVTRQARRGSGGSVAQGLEAGLPGLPLGAGPRRGGARSGPGWPIGLAADRCQGGVQENGTSWAIQLCEHADFGMRRATSVNTSAKGRIPARKRPSMQDRARAGGTGGLRW